MSWHFLQGEEVGSWEENSLDGAPSALLKLMPQPGNGYLPECATASSSLSRFGMMCAPLMDSPGPEMWTLSRVGSLVRTSRVLGTALGSQEKRVGCGRKWPESLARFDQDSCSWKTSQTYLFEDSGPSLGIFPAWGSMRNGECWARIRWELGIVARGPGLLLPTLIGSDSKQVAQHHGQNLSLTGVLGGRVNPTWGEWHMGFPIGWTDCESLAWPKYQKWLDAHSSRDAAA